MDRPTFLVAGVHGSSSLWSKIFHTFFFCYKWSGNNINGQGIRRKVHEIRENLQNMDLDVMGIAETLLLPGEKKILMVTNG